MASLLSSLNRAQRLKPPPHLTCLLAPPALSSPTHIQTRNASAHTKQQKKTIAKYSARQAIKGGSGKGTDFLSQAKVQTRGDKGKKGGAKKGVEEEPTGEVKDRLAEASGPVREDTYAGGIPPLEDAELENPDFRRTTPRYEEYERLLPEKEHEEVTATMLKSERDAMIKRLWEPFETEDFNLKSLLGNNPPPEKVEGPDVVLQDARPSKMLYYTEEELQRYLPEGVAGRITKEFETFKKKGVMVRPVVEDVVGWLADWRRKQFIGRKMDEDYYTILGGPIGCGKSVSLNPIVQWARLTGWLVVFIPDGKDWASHGYLSYSKVNETWFGQPQLATKWITALLNAHGDKLAAIPLRTDFVVQDVDPDKPTFTSSPQETLRSLLEYGLKHPDQASDCVWYFRQELCTVSEYPVLIVVDGVNVIRDHSPYGDPIDPYVFAPNLDTSRLVLSRAFQDFRHHGLTNGTYVGTFCSSASMRAMKVRRPNVDLLRTRYDLDPRLNVLEVPPISRAEAHVLSEWYRENEVYVSDMPAQTVDYLWAMSQGNGDIFWKQTGPQ